MADALPKMEEDSLSAKIIDSVCGPLFEDPLEKDDKIGSKYSASSYAYSEEVSEEDSRMVSEDDTYDEDYDSRRRGRRGKKVQQTLSESDSFVTQSDYEGEDSKKKKKSSRRGLSDDSESYISAEESYREGKKRSGPVTEAVVDVGISKPLSSSFAKRCYFTKAGIGKTTQHYEGLTLTGNVVLMLSGAMKLKGCPTICDEDLRRVEQTYPNQFSRLPDELLLSSGWRRISKYCHFSNKPIPDGIPFFHSKQRVHPSGGYYFLLAAAVGMIRPIDVEPLTRDTLVLLETDYPTQCDAAPPELIEDPNQWTLVDKFCFFSGGPINTEEDVYYEADFDGNPIYMLAFLSPSLTPDELYKLGPDYAVEDPGLKSVAAVEEVESVYDLTERDFDDLKLYHLGPCRALPPYILVPQGWTKVLPPHFLAARQQALLRALDFEETHGVVSPTANSSNAAVISPSKEKMQNSAQDEFTYDQQQAAPNEPGYYNPEWGPDSNADPAGESAAYPTGPGFAPQQQFGQDVSHGPPPNDYNYYESSQQGSRQSAASYSSDLQHSDFQREVEEEGAFMDSTAAPIDEALARHQMELEAKPAFAPARPGMGAVSPPGRIGREEAGSPGVDPPDDEPPSLSRRDIPDDEGGFQEEYMENPPDEFDTGGDGGYYEDEGPYDADKMGASPTSEDFQNGQYYDDEGQVYESPEKGSEEYYSRDEEYYDSPEQPAQTDVSYPSEEGGFSEDPGSFPRDAGIVPTDSGGFPLPSEDYSDSAGQEPQDPNRAFSPQSDDFFTSPTESKDQSSVTESGSGTGFSAGEDNLRARAASPTSGSTDYSQSSAMRNAQEMLRRNRQRRLEGARPVASSTTGPEDENVPKSPGAESEVSETASDNYASEVSGSSAWTDSSIGDRSSRRALILQMAKARMKSHKSHQAPIQEEASVGEATSRSEPKTDIDFTGELD